MSWRTTRAATAWGVALAFTALLALPVATAAAEPTTTVRILHGVADAPAVDVYAGEERIVQDLAFPTLTDYVTLPAGEYQLRVVPAGAELTDENVVMDTTVSLLAGLGTTVAATGSLAAGITPQTVLDNPYPVVDQGQVRVVHVAADAPAVDIAPVGGDAIVSDLGYGQNSSYLNLDPGSYALEVREAGGTDAVLTLPPLDLPAGTSTSAFAVGSLADQTFQVVTGQDAGIPTTAQVRVLNGSPDAPSMDLVVNGVRLFGNLPFGVSSPYITVPVGGQVAEIGQDSPLVVQLVQSGAALADSPVLVETSVPFVADSRSTIVVSNTADALEASVVLDSSDVKKKGAQLRVGHLSADAPSVDVAVDGAAAKDALLKDVPYLTVSDYLRVKPGKLDLDVREPGTKTVIADLPALELAKGTNYSAYAIGSPADGTFQVVVLEDASAR